MAVIDVWNQALSEIGALRGAGVADIAENSKEAAVCRIHYNNLRTSILRAAHWSCARFQASLTVVESYKDNPPTNQFPWLYGYTYPDDCLKMRYILNPPVIDSNVVNTGDVLNWWRPSRNNRFLPALDNDGDAKVILTNVENALGVYTKDLTDPALWDQGLWDAIVSALQAKIVIPLTGNVQMKGTFEQLAVAAVREARAQDGNEAMPTTDHIPDWIQTRGGGCNWPDGGQGPGIWYAGWDSLSWGE